MAQIFQFRIEYLGFPPHVLSDMHHITYFCTVRIVSSTCLWSFSRSASNFRTRSVVFFRKMIHFTVQLPQLARILDGLLHCGNQTLPWRIAYQFTYRRICSLYSAIRDRTPSKERIMASTELSSKVKVEVPHPTSLVVDLVRVARFPNISFCFLVTGRSSLLNSIRSSSFEPW